MRLKYFLQDQAGGDTAGGGGSGSDTVAGGSGADAGGGGAAYDWTKSGIDATGLAVVHERQWKGPSDLLSSYVNLEKFTGTPPDQLLKLPKEMTAEAMAPIYDRLGRPKTADEYKLPVPDGGNTEYSKEAQKWMHEAGLSHAQALKIAEKNNQYTAAAKAKAITEYTTKVTEEAAALKKDWGPNHDSNVAIAQQAAKTFGMTKEQVDGLEQQLGFAGVHKFLFNIGAKLGEAEFHDGRPGNFTGMSVEIARAKYDSLTSDVQFVARFNSKDPVVAAEARAEKLKLSKLAYPGEQSL